MTKYFILVAAAALAGATGGCSLSGQPTDSAYAHNVGAGSSVFGPESTLGMARSGNTVMPGAPAAGGINAVGGE